MAIDRRSDPGRIKNETTDLQRDLAAKGGPAVGIGDAQNRQVSSPADDLRTKAAATGSSKRKEKDEPSRESQTKNRSGNRVSGSNH